MPYIYRYIDIDKEEVVYVGKVTRYKDVGYDPLRNRHEQHCREDWYKNDSDHIVMQYIELDSPVDADIVESWLINFYDTGQLINKAKTGWGKSKLDLYTLICGRWRTFGLNSGMREDSIEELISSLVLQLKKYTEGFTVNIDSNLTYFCNEVKRIQKEWQKAQKLSRFDAQCDFRRGDPKVL